MTIFDYNYLQPPSPMRLQPGVNFALEEEADKWLAIAREGVTALGDKRDYLTRDQLQLRASREVLNHNGVSDEALFSGIFRRSHNPLLGHRPSKRRSSSDE
jgi:hypothetical protein